MAGMSKKRLGSLYQYRGVNGSAFNEPSVNSGGWKAPSGA